MSLVQKSAAVALLVLLAATGYGLWYTSQSTPAQVKRGQPTARPGASPVDEATLITAQRLAQLASGTEEQSLAQSAVRLADHELDLALTLALREAEAHPPVLSPEAQRIQNRLQKSQQLLENDQAHVAQLTAVVGQARGPEKSSLQDELDLAQSQLELDRDEVEEANQDLLEAGGNLHQRIQTMLQEHAAAQHSHPAASVAGRDPLASLHGIVRELRQWLALRTQQQWLIEAGRQAAASAAQMSAERARLAMQLEASKASVPELAHHTKRAKSEGSAAAVAPTPQTTGAETLLSRAREIAADQKLLTLLDQRIADRRQLSAVYEKWSAAVAAQTRSVLHAALKSVALLIALVLVLLYLDHWLERLLGRTRLDRRQVETVRTVTRVGLQILGVVTILLVLVGLPGQLGTMLGLAGAGLTVALKDFIVAFIGWLVLMGKNGIRLGDWVEINGVSGEVVELGMFHTVLLETGNWTDAGHPTGRRVTFTNSFAIQGHYFNFSTSGQWLWDEVLVLVPYDRDPHSIAAALHKEVLAATAENARLAEHEWRRAVRGQGGGTFSAAPGISVRPAVGGVEVAIRYVTRASERSGLRARLYQSAVQWLAQNSTVAPRVT